ncbi:G-protein coupled receptor, putative [Ixodes scapularis]|uniref:G-protein coupled receptor, putative n=1 Tax=Ixodes scapularis TaxID=6945 RepID=B7PPJ2_IXOSC|nr:G-protein coupled receptor, putative [Ixodes scapularis]|eukprot:XP_002435684.1 G-protein coupled receptor, putative [Ixodes scapularis]
MQLHVDRTASSAIQHAALFNNLTTRYHPALSNSIQPDDGSSSLRFSPSEANQSPPEDVDQPSSFNYINLEVHYILLLAIMVSSVAVNGLVFVLFYQRPSVRMTSNKFVLNMAIVHLLQTFLILPFVFVSAMFQEWIFGDIWCKIHGAVSVCLTMANVFSILLIAVDRNCAVNSPLHYSMTITKKRTSGLILSMWFFAVLLSTPPLIGVSDIKYQETWSMCTVTWYETDLLTIAYSCVLEESTETCNTSCSSSYGQDEWGRHFLDQSQRRNSAARRESHGSASAMVVNETHPLPGIAQVHHYSGINAPVATTNYCCRPVLKRGRSFAFDEQELSIAYPPQRISQSVIRVVRSMNGASK